MRGGYPDAMVTKERKYGPTCTCTECLPDERIRELNDLAETGVSIPEMAEAVGVRVRTASAVVRALRHMKPLSGQGEVYGRTKGVHGKMKGGR